MELSMVSVIAILVALALGLAALCLSIPLYDMENCTEKRKAKLEWARLIVICLFGVAIITHLVIDFKLQLHCPNCDAVVTTPYCEQCGEQLDATTTCASCGEKLDTPFCGRCGASADLNS